MSKFLDLCEKVKSTLMEQGEMPPLPADSGAGGSAQPAPGQPDPNAEAPGAPMVDPNAESEIKVVTNDEIKDFVAAMKDFYQSGNALSAEEKDEISKLPSTAEDKDISKIIDTLTRIFQDAKLPKDTSETES